jgi:hypothetical protein
MFMLNGTDRNVMLLAVNEFQTAAAPLPLAAPLSMGVESGRTFSSGCNSPATTLSVC